MEGHNNPFYHHHHNPPHLQHHHPNPTAVIDPSDRFPQWSVQETKEFLMIRAELDQTFMETKRNKVLWDVVSNKMKEKGFVRSAEQCKCKWKNLVTRYKGFETMEPEAMRQQFPYYNELQAIFSSRIQRMLWTEQSEGAGTSGIKRKPSISHLSYSEEDDDNDESEELLISGSEINPQKSTTSISRKKSVKKGKSTAVAGTGEGSGVRDLLEEFMRQTIQMERDWREMWERSERERAEREREWRMKMEELERERAAAERRWMEREEERKVREEVRAQKRDELINALLHKLNGTQQDHQNL